MDSKKVLVNCYVDKLINKFKESGYDMDEDNTIFMKELFGKTLHNIIEDAKKLYEKDNKINQPDMNTSIDALIQLLIQMKTNKDENTILQKPISSCNSSSTISKLKISLDEPGLDGRKTNPYNYFTKWVSVNYANERKKNGLPAWKPRDFSKMWQIANKQLDKSLWKSIADNYNDDTSQ